MKISNTSLVILSIFIVLPVVFGPSILASYEEHRIAPFLGSLFIVFGAIGLLFFYHLFWKREEARQVVDVNSIKKNDLIEAFIQFLGKFVGSAWIFSWVPLFMGISIIGEIGQSLSENIGYQPAEFVFLIISILLIFCMLYLYRRQPTNFGKFLVTFCALISVGIIAGIIGHMLSGNEMLFKSPFS